jgi:hypothetical protein
MHVAKAAVGGAIAGAVAGAFILAALYLFGLPLCGISDEGCGWIADRLLFLSLLVAVWLPFLGLLLGGVLLHLMRVRSAWLCIIFGAVSGLVLMCLSDRLLHGEPHPFRMPLFTAVTSAITALIETRRTSARPGSPTSPEQSRTSGS